MPATDENKDRLEQFLNRSTLMGYLPGGSSAASESEMVLKAEDILLSTSTLTSVMCCVASASILSALGNSTLFYPLKMTRITHLGCCRVANSKDKS